MVPLQRSTVRRILAPSPAYPLTRLVKDALAYIEHFRSVRPEAAPAVVPDPTFTPRPSSVALLDGAPSRHHRPLLLTLATRLAPLAQLAHAHVG